MNDAEIEKLLAHIEPVLSDTNVGKKSICQRTSTTSAVRDDDLDAGRGSYIFALSS